MNLDKAEQNNKRLQEIDKAFHRHFGGEEFEKFKRTKEEMYIVQMI